MEGLGFSKLILEQTKKDQLKDFSRSRSLPINGVKADLINRIMQHASEMQANYYEENEVSKSKFHPVPVAQSSELKAHGSSFDIEQGIHFVQAQAQAANTQNWVNTPMDMTCNRFGKVSVNIPTHAIVPNSEFRIPDKAQDSNRHNEWLIYEPPKAAAISSSNVSNNEWLSKTNVASPIVVSTEINQPTAYSSSGAPYTAQPYTHRSLSRVEQSHIPTIPIHSPHTVCHENQCRVSLPIDNTTPDSSESNMSRRQELDYAIAESIEGSKMPLVEPGVFEGEMLTYTRWAKSFDAFISKRKQLSASDRLYYLEKYTTGEARELIEHYLTMNSDQAYHEAKKDLEQTYGNAYLISQAYKRKLANWPKISPKDNVGIKKLANFLKQCRAMKEESSYMNSLDEWDRNQEIVRKLPDYMMFRWNNEVTKYQLSHDQVFPPFSKFVDFLVFESNAANNPVTSMGALRESSTLNTAKLDKSNISSKSHQGH